jgi:hypothetical protein
VASIPDGRFVLEAVAKTLGFPLRQLPTRAEVRVRVS